VQGRHGAGVVTDGTARLRALSEVPEGEVSAALATTGLWFDVGVATLRVRSDAPALAAQLRSVYANFPFRSDADWADLHVDLLRPRGPRRWLRPQVKLRSDGLQPFAPFAADSPLPLLEWGANWLIGRRTNDVLLLHAGVVERDGLALVMPAMPGSGKSTLTAALSLRGWRLLSDEFGAFDLQADAFAAVLKPVALKNASIDVIRRFEPSAPIGPSFPKTRKGVVAHLAASTDAVARVKQACLAGAVILPRWQADQPTSWEPLDEQEAFSALAFNAFNYPITGAAGFRAVVGLVRRCPAWQLVYSDLDHALATIEAAWPRVVEQHRMAQP
jgi:hypothetical protein